MTDLLYIDDLNIFASSQCKLNLVMKSTKTAMGDIGLRWNRKTCTVVHVRRKVHTHNASGIRLDDSARVPDLEEGKQYKFLGVLERVIQEDKLSLERRLRNIYVECLLYGQAPCLIITA